MTDSKGKKNISKRTLFKTQIRKELVKKQLGPHTSHSLIYFHTLLSRRDTRQVRYRSTLAWEESEAFRHLICWSPPSAPFFSPSIEALSFPTGKIMYLNHVQLSSLLIICSSAPPQACGPTLLVWPDESTPRSPDDGRTSGSDDSLLLQVCKW